MQHEKMKPTSFSPGPWYFDGEQLRDGEGRPVFDSKDWELAKNNHELIVQVVNVHFELVVALTSLVVAVGEIPAALRTEGMNKAINVARSAIDKVIP